MVDGHGFCQNNNVGNLAHLGRLNVKRQEGEGQPASVTRRALDAPNEKHGDESEIEKEQKRSLSCKDVDVEGGEGEIQNNACNHGACLNGDIVRAFA